MNIYDEIRKTAAANGKTPEELVEMYRAHCPAYADSLMALVCEPCCDALTAIHLLQCLKGTIERMSMFGYADKCDHSGLCPADSIQTLYCSAMDEAIRCIGLVNGCSTQA